MLPYNMKKQIASLQSKLNYNILSKIQLSFISTHCYSTAIRSNPNNTLLQYIM